MTYKEALFFIGKCLTITHEPHNKILIENELKSENIDWDAVVKVSTSHYVFPALYCNLKRANFLHYVPQDLVAYMKHITDLNRERNQQIIEQAKEINELLLTNNITPIFLKGTGNLLEGLYVDIAERMVGDIDFIVSDKKIKKVVNVLKLNGYYENELSGVYPPNFRHYPRLLNSKKISAVEIHQKIIELPFDKNYNYQDIKRTIKVAKYNCKVLDSNNQIVSTILAKQLNDKWYSLNNFDLRSQYDIYLLSLKINPLISIKLHPIFFKELNSFLGIGSYLFNFPASLKYNKNKKSKKYIKNFFIKVENPRYKNLHNNILRFMFLINSITFYFLKSTYDKKYRIYLKNKITDMDFIKRKFGFTKPTS
jgi:hypothetical protein